MSTWDIHTGICGVMPACANLTPGKATLLNSVSWEGRVGQPLPGERLTFPCSGVFQVPPPLHVEWTDGPGLQARAIAGLNPRVNMRWSHHDWASTNHQVGNHTQWQRPPTPSPDFCEGQRQDSAPNILCCVWKLAGCFYLQPWANLCRRHNHFPKPRVRCVSQES